MGRFGVVALVACLFLVACGRPSPPRFSEEDEVFDDFIDEYYRARYQFYPSEATPDGFPGHDDRLERLDRDGIVARIEWLVDFRQRLIALRVEELSRFAHPEALWLRSQVEAELWELEQWGGWRRVAEFYLTPIERGLLSLLPREPRGAYSPLLGRLRQIPALVGHAQENLGPFTEPERRAARRAVYRTAAFVSAVLDELRPSLRAHERQEVTVAQREAMTALESLRVAVQNVAPAPKQHALGEESFRQYWIYSAMIDQSPTAIELMAERELARLEDEISETLLVHFAGESLSSVMARSEIVLPSSPENEIRSLIDALSQTPSPLGRVRVQATARVRVVASDIVAPYPLRVLPPSPLEPRAEGTVLVSREHLTDGTGWHHLARVSVRALLGDYLQNDYRSRSMSLVRKVGSARVTREGWAHFMEEELLAPAFGGEPRWSGAIAGSSPDATERARAWFRVYVLRTAVTEQLRLIGSIRLHRDRVSDDALMSLIREHLDISDEELDRELQSIHIDPGVGSAALGKLLLRALRRDHQFAHPAVTVDEFYERVLNAGILPPRLIRFRLLGETSPIEIPEFFGGARVSRR